MTLRPVRLLPLAVGVSLGCRDGKDADPPPPDDTQTEDTGPVDPCATPFRDVELRDDALYVDATSVAADPDGSAEAPFPTVAAALAVGLGRQILVEPGTYAETVVLPEGADGTELAGRCPEAVLFEAGGDTEALVVEVTVGAEEAVSLSGFSTHGGAQGIAVRSGSAVGHDLLVSGSAVLGVNLGAEGGPGGHVVLRRVEVRDTVEAGRGAYGLGMQVGWGHSLELYEARIEAAHGIGFIVTDPTVDGAPTAHVEGLEVRGLVESEVYDGLAMAVLVEYQAVAELDGLVLDGNVGTGVAVLNPGTTLDMTGLSVSDTRSFDAPAPAWGGQAMAVSGGSVTCTDCVFGGSEGVGILLEGAEASLELLGDWSVTDTSPDPEGTGGYGIQVGPGTLVATGGVLSGNHGAGILAGDGAQVSLVGTTVQGTLASADTASGEGLSVQGTAVLGCTDCLVTGNQGAGYVVIEGELQVTGGSVQGTLPDADSTNGGALYAFAGAQVTLGELTVAENPWAAVVAAGNGTVVTARGLSVSGVRDTSGLGVFLFASSDGALLDLGESTIRSSDGVALSASQGGALVAADVQISDMTATPTLVATPAISAYEGGSVTAVRVDAARIVGFGVSVGRSSTLVLDDSHFTEILPVAADATPEEVDLDGVGVIVSGGSRAELAGVEVDGAPGEGLLVSDEGTVVYAEDCVFTNTSATSRIPLAWGATVQAGAHAELVRTEISGTMGIGVVVDDATATFEDLSVLAVDRTGEGGLGQGLLIGGGAVVEARGLVVDGTEGPGITVALGATLDCAACEVTDNQYAGLQVYRGEARFTEGSLVCGTEPDSTGEGGGIGVMAADDDGTTRLLLDGVEVCAHPVAGVQLMGAGAFEIRDSSLAAAAESEGSLGLWGNAVASAASLEDGGPWAGTAAWDGATGLLLESNDFTSGADATIFLSGGGATICGNRFDGDGVAVRRQLVGAEDLLDGCDADTVSVELDEDGRIFRLLEPVVSYSLPTRL